MSESRIKESIQLLLTCVACGKPIDSGVGIHASLTQWIFKRDRCECLAGKIQRQSLSGSGANSEATSQPTVFPEHNTIAGRYDVEYMLGQGGMGCVYKATERSMRETFAIKMLHAELVADKGALRRFEEEARAAQDLTHPNLVAVYDHGFTSDGVPFIVMDYLEGDSLATLISREHSLSTAQALDVFIQIADGMSHAHLKNVIHRDLKPTNIIITKSPCGHNIVKVVDFGIAKVLSPGKESQSITGTGEILGSPYYMSPEQCLGHRMDKRSDIYSLGCVMYEALAGRVPFEGDNTIQTIVKHINEEPSPLSLLQIDVPKDLESVVMQALEKKPADRYQSMDELKRDLELIREGRSPSRRPPSRKIKKFGIGGLVSVGAALTACLSVIAFIGCFWISQSKYPHTTNESLWKQLDLEGQSAVDQGNYARAKDNFLHAYNFAKAIRDNSSLLVASLNELLDLNRIEGKETAAAEIAQQLTALAERDKDSYLDLLDQLRNVSSSTTKTRVEELCNNANDLVVLLSESGEYDRAQRLVDASYQLTHRVLGDRAMPTIRSLHNRAYNLHGMGAYNSAFTAYQAAIAAERKFLPDANAHLAASSLELARLNMQLEGQSTFSKGLIEEALKYYRITAGINSQQVAWARYHLAQLYYSQGHMEDAEKELTTALSIYDKTDNKDALAGVSHEAVCYALLSEINRQRQRFEESNYYCDKALSLAEGQTNKNYCLLAKVLIDAAENCRGSNVARARALLKRASAISQRLGAHIKDESQIQIYSLLALLARQEHDFPQSKQYYLQALALQTKAFGGESWQAIVTIIKLGIVSEEIKDNRAANEYFEKASSIVLSKGITAPPIYARNSMYRLVRHWQKIGSKAMAATIEKNCLSRSPVYGAPTPWAPIQTRMNPADAFED